MTVVLTSQTVVTAGAVLAALTAIFTLLWRIFKWADRQKRQDAELEETRKELALLTYGVLACLKGLKEQGCNGPVTDAIQRIEKFINKQAHRAEE